MNESIKLAKSKALMIIADAISKCNSKREIDTFLETLFKQVQTKANSRALTLSGNVFSDKNSD